MKLGLCGYGAMGKTHAYAVAALPYYYDPLPFAAKVGGVVTTSLEKSKRVCEQCGFERAYETFDAMLADPSIDCVSICTPNLYHYDQVKAAIEAGKHVYCEKPLCVTTEQAWELAAMIEEKGLCGQVVFQNRYHGAVMASKRLIEAGKIGRVLSFRFSYLHASCVDPTKAAGWKQDGRVNPGGVLFDLGSHVLDLCLHLLGQVERIGGVSQIGFSQRVGMDGEKWATDANEAFYMTLKMKNGAFGMVEASKLASGETDDLSFAIYGDKGALKFSLTDPHSLFFCDLSSLAGQDGFVKIPCGGRFEAPGGGFPSPKAPCGWLRGHVGSMYAFLAAVFEGKDGSPSFAQGAYVQKLMETAMASDKEEGRLLPVCLSDEEVRLCSFSD